MKKLFAICLLGCLAACNNNKPADAPPPSSSPVTTKAPVDSVAREEEMNFIDGCLDNAKLTLGEQKAFAFCRCMYAQTKVRIPDMDSAKIAALDTATLGTMAAGCR